jgi:hypothetical protein
MLTNTLSQKIICCRKKSNHVTKEGKQTKKDEKQFFEFPDFNKHEITSSAALLFCCGLFFSERFASCKAKPTKLFTLVDHLHTLPILHTFTYMFDLTHYVTQVARWVGNKLTAVN